MKRMIMAVLLAATGAAHATDTIDPQHAKVIMTMACRWVDPDGTVDGEPQTFTLYRDWNNAEWLEITPAKGNPIKPPVFVKGPTGAFMNGDVFKDYFWQGNSTRLTLLSKAKTAQVIIEEIRSPAMPVSPAECTDLKFTRE